MTRSPLTAIVFAFELTHDAGSLLALLVAATVSHLVSVLVLERSILTEKVARRGFHVMREYAVDRSRPRWFATSWTRTSSRSSRTGRSPTSTGRCRRALEIELAGAWACHAIPPDVDHEMEPLGAVRFSLEFLRRTPRD